MASWEISLVVLILGLAYIFLKISENFSQDQRWFPIGMRWLFFAMCLLTLLLAFPVSVQIIHANNGTTWATVNQTLVTTPYTYLENDLLWGSGFRAQMWAYVLIAAFAFFWFVTEFVLMITKQKWGKY